MTGAEERLAPVAQAVLMGGNVRVGNGYAPVRK